MEENFEFLTDDFLTNDAKIMEEAAILSKKIGKQLKETIEVNGINIVNMSRILSLPERKISKILNGDPNAKILDIIKIADFLDLEIEINFM